MSHGCSGFALCHGCVSSPPVQELTANLAEHQVNMAAMHFCNDQADVIYNPTGSSSVLVPAYFDWYQEDFSSHAHGSSKAQMDVLAWIGVQLSDTAAFAALIKSGKNGHSGKVYYTLNWQNMQPHCDQPTTKAFAWLQVELNFKPFVWEFCYRFNMKSFHPTDTIADRSSHRSDQSLPEATNVQNNTTRL